MSITPYLLASASIVIAVLVYLRFFSKDRFKDFEVIMGFIGDSLIILLVVVGLTGVLFAFGLAWERL